MKTNILFFLFPFRGHTVQALKIIEELCKTGKYNIYVDIGADFETLVPINAKKHRCLYDYTSKRLQNEYLKEELIDYGEGILSTLEKYREWFSEIKFCPDIVCFDSLAYWGKVLAYENSIFSIALHTIQPFDTQAFYNDGFRYLKPYTDSFSSEEEFRRIIHVYSKIAIGKYHLRSNFDFADLLSGKGDYNLVLVPQYLCKYSNSLNCNDMLYNPVITNDLSKKKKKLNKKKIIYVSTGSIIENEEFLVRCINICLKLKEYKVYVSAGQFADDLIKKYRNNAKVRIYDFAPQMGILESASLFITHGGMNSICEAIYYQTPMVVFPFINDEFLNAKMIADNGLGIMISNRTFDNSLLYKLNSILTDYSYKSRLKKASQEMKCIDTVKVAGNIFDALIKKIV